MAQIRSTESNDMCDFVGPLLDDGAPYSGIGVNELKLLDSNLSTNFRSGLDPIPSEIKDRPFWKYGTGNHASELRKILGSILISGVTDCGTNFQIRHLVIEGSSKWIVGQNVTAKCDILHIGGNYLKMPNGTKTCIVIYHTSVLKIEILK